MHNQLRNPPTPTLPHDQVSRLSAEELSGLYTTRMKNGLHLAPANLITQLALLLTSARAHAVHLRTPEKGKGFRV